MVTFDKLTMFFYWNYNKKEDLGGIMKKFISLCLVFSVLALSGNLFAKERRGADIEIYKTKSIEASPDLRGELIAVKQNSLLLLEHESGIDKSVDIKDINIIKILKKSKTLAWGSIGLLSGGVMGALFGYIEGDDQGGYLTWLGLRFGWMEGLLTAEEKALYYGIYAGFFGAILGGIIGTIAGADKTIQIEGMTDSEIQETLDKLLEKARIPNYK